jgi:hypothetical protein
MKRITSGLQRSTGLMLFKEKITICCGIHMKHRITFSGQNAEFHFAEAGEKYIDHWTLKGQ